MSDILPTYSCFDDAIELITHRVQEDGAIVFGESVILVHGIALGSVGDMTDKPYAHAWVEEDGLCWDCGLLDGEKVWYAVKHDDFYAARRITETTRYTIRQMLAENLKHVTFGPWDEKYQALCGQDHRVFGSFPVSTDSADT